MRPYEIRTRDTYWRQYACQFSRELCHVMTGFGRFKRHRHKWFEESLCEAASLFVLHRLTEVWAEEPPLRVASEFAPNHATYAEAMEEKYRAFPGIARPGWLAAKLEAGPRGLDGAAAVALPDGFRRDPTLWRDCLSLNRWDPSADATFSDYLESWTTFLRECGSAARAPALARKTFQPGLAASCTVRRRRTVAGRRRIPKPCLRPKNSNVIHPQVPEKSHCGESGVAEPHRLRTRRIAFALEPPPRAAKRETASPRLFGARPGANKRVACRRSNQRSRQASQRTEEANPAVPSRPCAAPTTDPATHERLCAMRMLVRPVPCVAAHPSPGPAPNP